MFRHVATCRASSCLRLRLRPTVPTPRCGARFKSSPALEKASADPVSTTKTTTKTTTATTTTQSVPIATSLLAALLGVGTVSAAAAAVESATASHVPPFMANNGERFDQSNFSGRFSRMLLACDPRLLLYTNEQVRQAQAVVRAAAGDSLSSDSSTDRDRVLWEAKRIVDAAVHPDTDQIIPRPFRMSGYVPYNGPVCVALVAAQSTPALLFWSWVNQSQNALVNYYNRNAASPMTTQTLLTSYSIAVGSALTVAFGLATLIQKRYPPAQAKALLRWVAFPSAIVASSLNCYIVRSPEITSGIPLQTADGQDVLPGTTSQVAARKGVHLTTSSRALLQAPVYFLPPLLIASGPLQRYLVTNPVMAVPLTTYLVLVSFGVGLPFSIGLFPQICSIDASQVEPKFQHLRDANGEPYKVYYYNKGL